MDVLFMIDATGSMANTIQAAHEKAEDLAFELHISNRKALFKFACICYRDPVYAPSDVHQVFDFDEEIENLATFLEDVKASGGGDGPEDYVGALNEAFNSLSWRDNSKRAIIWIADAPAHGQRYCGSSNHQEEEPKLEPLVKQLAQDRYYFVSISLNNGEKDPDKEIPFRIESFSPEKGNEIKRITETMAESTKAMVNEALFE